MTMIHDRAKSIFLSASEITSPGERRAFVDAQCAGDELLRNEVEELLRHENALGSFLEGPVGDFAATIDRPSIAERPGTIIGPYKLLQQIGEGGMGVVFMAEQTEPIERTVALKIIKPGMDTRQVIARFEAERQALAMMDHPNIAKVLDAGTTAPASGYPGRPYFVMELVKGVPITKFCDEKQLPVRERLGLFKAVCEAVQHAHQKGIIHRDIKPTNVLVAEYDNRAIPKVIDFGVAKANAQKLTDRTMFTEFGQVVGTIEYMSPEQAKFNQLDIDTRSDIYSLGVLLYELLAGSPPFERQRLQHAAIDEALRIIREEEPPKPSTRLSTSDAMPSIAANRHTEPAQLSKAVRGELDWIVMKALEKDRNRRYETASGFAADVERYLSGEAVLACPPSASYRLRKFASRNKASLVVGGVIAAAMLLGLVGTTWQAIRAEKARQAEAEQRSIAEAARATADAERKTAESQRAEADKQRVQAEANFAMARQAVDEYFTNVSESALLDVPGLEPLRGELLESALRFYEKFSVDRTNDPAVLTDLAKTYLRVAVVNSSLNRNDEAVAALARAQSLVDRLLDEFPQAGDEHRRLAGFWIGMRPAHQSTATPKNPAAALQTISGLIATWESLARQFPDVPGFQSDVAAINYAAGDLLGVAQAEKAIPYFERSRSILQGLVNSAPTNALYRDDLARTRDQLARAFPRVGRDADAEVECREALLLRERLVEGFPHAPQYRNALTTCLKRYAGYVRKRDPAEADRLTRRAKDLTESIARDYPNMPLYRLSWLVGQVVNGDEVDIAKVLQFLDESVANCPESPARRDELARLLRRVAEALPQTDEYRPEFVRLHRSSLQLFQDLEREFPDNHSYREGVGHAARQLAFALGPAGDAEEKRKLFELASKAFEQLSKADIDQRDGFYQGYYAATLKQLALVLAANKQLDYGESAARQSVEIFETLTRKYPDNASYHQGMAWSLSAEAAAVRGRATLLAGQGKLTDALATAQEAVRLAPNEFHSHSLVLDTLTRLGDPEKTLAVMRENVAAMPDSGMAHHHLGTALHRQDRHAEAIPEFQKAIELVPTWEWPHLCIASSYASLGQWDIAADEYAKGFEMDPPSWWKVVGSLKEKKNPEASEKVLRKVLAVADGRAADAKTRLIRGLLHRELREWDKAIEDATWVIDQDKKLVEAWDLRGKCYLDKRENAKAEADFSAAIKLSPERTAFWTGRAFSHFHRQQWDDAIADYSKSIELAPEIHTNWLHRGHAYLQLAQWDKAAADFSKLVEQWPRDSGGWFFLAAAHTQMNQPDDAMSDLRQAIANGFNDIEHLKTYSKLDPIRSRADFTELVAELEGKRSNEKASANH